MTDQKKPEPKKDASQKKEEEFLKKTFDEVKAMSLFEYAMYLAEGQAQVDAAVKQAKDARAGAEFLVEKVKVLKFSGFMKKLGLLATGVAWAVGAHYYIPIAFGVYVMSFCIDNALRMRIMGHELMAVASLCKANSMQGMIQEATIARHDTSITKHMLESLNATKHNNELMKELKKVMESI